MTLDDIYEKDYAEEKGDELSEIDAGLEAEAERDFYGDATDPQNFTEDAQNAQYGGDD